MYLDKKKWSNAKQYCKQNDGAELVTITDGFEQAFMNLLTYVKTNADPWIGLQKVAKLKNRIIKIKIFFRILIIHSFGLMVGQLHMLIGQMIYCLT